MIVHFADRELRIVHSASNELMNGSHIIDDSITDDVRTGMMHCTITTLYNEQMRVSAIPGNYMLIGGSEWLLFNILSVTFDNENNTLEIYGEDSGMDLINRQVGAFQPTSDVVLSSVVSSILGTSAEITIDYRVSPSLSKGASYFDYTSDETALARLQSILAIFGCEFYFLYTVSGLNKIERHLVIEQSVMTYPVHDFHYGVDVSRITEVQSVEDLATRFLLYGKDNKALSSLSGYSTYSGATITPTDSRFSGSRTHTYKVEGNTVTCVDVNWRSSLNPSGIIERKKTTEYTDAKTLISYAMTELEKVVDTAFSYQVDFVGKCIVNAGDYIRIIDEDNDIFLESRIVSLTYSNTSDEWSAELGYYRRVEGSKAETISIPTDVDLSILSLTSTSGLIGRGTLDTTIVATLYRNGTVITTSQDLAEGERLVWYEDGVEMTDERVDDFAISVSITEGKTYTCELVGGDDGE